MFHARLILYCSTGKHQLISCTSFTGKLVLKIPWKSLYSEPVIANIEGLYLLVRPNTGMLYILPNEGAVLLPVKVQTLIGVFHKIYLSSLAQ